MSRRLNMTSVAAKARVAICFQVSGSSFPVPFEALEQEQEQHQAEGGQPGFQSLLVESRVDVIVECPVQAPPAWRRDRAMTFSSSR